MQPTPISAVMRFRMLPAAALVSLAIIAPASGSELVQDPNAALLSLKVNAKGEALLTYRRADGRLRRVLAWGAVNARPPSAEIPQVRFRSSSGAAPSGWPRWRTSPAAPGATSS